LADSGGGETTAARKEPTCRYGANLEDANDRGYDALRRLFLIEMARAAEATFGP